MLRSACPLPWLRLPLEAGPAPACLPPSGALGPGLPLGQSPPVPFHVTWPLCSHSRPRESRQAPKVYTPTGDPLWRPEKKGENHCPAVRGALAVATSSSRGGGGRTGVALRKQWLWACGMQGHRRTSSRSAHSVGSWAAAPVPFSEKRCWSRLRSPRGVLPASAQPHWQGVGLRWRVQRIFSTAWKAGG